MGVPWALPKAGMGCAVGAQGMRLDGMGGAAAEGQRPAPIPAWGNAPGQTPPEDMRAESPFYLRNWGAGDEKRTESRFQLIQNP